MIQERINKLKKENELAEAQLKLNINKTGQSILPAKHSLVTSLINVPKSKPYIRLVGSVVSLFLLKKTNSLSFKDFGYLQNIANSIQQIYGYKPDTKH